MFYQVRSKGVLIGHADVSYGEMMPRSRGGEFYPNEAGAPLMPLFTEITRAHHADRRAQVTPPKGNEIPRPPEGWETRYADIMAAHRRAESLELTLCQMDGTPIPTQYITIRDLHAVLESNSVYANDDGAQDWKDPEEGDGFDHLDFIDFLKEEEAAQYHISIELERATDIP